MEQQKVFATVWRGFEKKTVIDYIYEQDVLFKKREAELSEKLAEYESKLEEQEYTADGASPSALYQDRIDALEQSDGEQREASELLQEQCEKLRRECDQSAQMVRSKDGQLQLQVEVNRQLQQKCDTLEGKLKTLAEHLIAERETIETIVVQLPKDLDKPVSMPEEVAAELDVTIVPDTAAKSADSLVKTEVTDLKDELNVFRQSVSNTLLNFEAALARLEADPSFFQ